MKQQIKVKTVLFVNWTTRDRDIEIDLPLMYFFEKILGWQVEHASMFNLPRILSLKPDIVLMPNTTGGARHVQVAKLVARSGIHLFSHVSEGMFRQNSLDEFVWGWLNRERKLPETLCMYWSERCLQMAVKKYPELKNTLRVSGAIGFDKYTYKTIFKNKENNNKKVIGYAAFDFNNIMSKKSFFISSNGEEAFNKLISLATHVNKILDKIIKNNPDINFLLKRHPNDGLTKISMEFDGLLGYQNVQLVENGKSIVDVITECDIWLNLNSSTNIEAWLLGKPCIAFLTDEKEFSSDAMFGNIIEDNPTKIQQHISEFYEKGSIDLFESKKSIRSQMIKEYIGYSDGLNHARYMSYLKQYIEKIEVGNLAIGEWKINKLDRLKGRMQHILYSFSKGRFNTPLLKKWASYYMTYDPKELAGTKASHYRHLDKFYEINREEIMSIYKRFAS